MRPSANPTGFGVWIFREHLMQDFIATLDVLRQDIPVRRTPEFALVIDFQPLKEKLNAPEKFDNCNVVSTPANWAFTNSCT